MGESKMTVFESVLLTLVVAFVLYQTFMIGFARGIKYAYKSINEDANRLMEQLFPQAPTKPNLYPIQKGPDQNQ